MNDFCVSRISLPANLRPKYGILSSEALLVTTDAQISAEHILRQAQLQAEHVMNQMHIQAEQKVRQQEQMVASQATHFLEVLQQAYVLMVNQVQDVVVELTQKMFDRLVLETTPRERIEAMFRRIRQEVPGNLVSAVAWVHPDDLGLVPESVWEVKVNPDMEPGTCKLEATNGEWRVDFTLASLSLRKALGDTHQLFPLSKDVVAEQNTMASMAEQGATINDAT